MAVCMKALYASLFALIGTGAFAQASQPDVAPVKIGIVDKNGAGLELSFLPPQEDGWQKKGNGLSVTLTKDGTVSGENREIEAYLITLDVPVTPIADYIERLKKNIQDAYENSTGFKLVVLEIDEDSGNERCARLHMLLEDIRNDDDRQKWSEQYVLSCGSLKYKRAGFEVRYYDRYYGPRNDGRSANQATGVLDSVVFKD